MSRSGQTLPLAEMTGLMPLSRLASSMNPQSVYEELQARWGPVAPASAGSAESISVGRANPRRV